MATIQLKCLTTPYITRKNVAKIKLLKEEHFNLCNYITDGSK